MPLDLDKIAQSIGKTGFKLEYEIGNILRKSGWQLISNRCYIDDLEGTVREIDLLAYKVSSVKDFSIYTAMIISCKKSEANAWALLSRPIEGKDPNYNWRPFKGWSNHPAINYYMSKVEWTTAYHEELSKECPALFAPPEIDVFAFQEMSKNNCTVQNDKNIFSSITSLMKAQSYEIGLLDDRQKNKKSVYQFNLVSVIDSEIIRIFFEDEFVKTSIVESEDYLCRYILNKKEEIARIKFVTANSFPKVLGDYSELHAKNREIFKNNYENFYSDAYKDWSKTQLLLADFNKSARSALLGAKIRHSQKFTKVSDMSISWYKNDKKLAVDIDDSDADIDLLVKFNADQRFKSEIAKALSDVFLYKGDFVFEIGIPF
jgi:hypothetical protein